MVKLAMQILKILTSRTQVESLQNRLIIFLQRPINMILVGSLLSFIIDFVFQFNWYSGKIDVLGAHDSEIPFFASYFITNSLHNFNFLTWNFHDQIDFAYPHLTTGIWTIPSGIIGLVANVFNLFFDINGKQFLILHLTLLSLIQIFIRVVGLALILFYLKLKPLPILITITLIQGLAFYTQTFQYLTGFVYSCIYILIYLLIRFFELRNISNLLYFIALYAFIILQIPLFATAYLGLAIHSITISFIIIKLKKYGISNTLNIILSEFRGQNFWILKKSELYFFIISALIIFLNLIFSLQMKQSLDNNYSLTSNRSDTLLPLPWFKGLLQRYGAMDFSSALNPALNDVAYSWQYLGFVFAALVTIGLFYLRSNIYFFLFILAAFLLYCLQFPLQLPIFDVGSELAKFPLWILSTFFGLIKGIFLILFPFWSLYRAPTMIIWLLIAVIVIPLAIVLNHIYSKRYVSKKIFYLILIIATVYSSIISEKKLAQLVILCCIFLFGFLKFIPLNKLHIFLLIAVVLQLLIDFGHLGLSQKNPVYAGSRIIPVEMTSKGSTTNQFYPQYNSPFADINLPIITNVSHYKVLPPSDALLLSTLDDRALFGRQSLNSYFYQTIFLPDYFGERYYQAKHKLFEGSGYPRLGTINPEFKSEHPFVQIYNLNNSGLSTLNFKGLNLYEREAEFYLKQKTYKINPNEATLSNQSNQSNQANKSNQNFFYSVSTDLKVRSTFFDDHKFVEFAINENKLKSVKGLPATTGQFDLNNFQKGKLIFISDKEISKNDNLIIKVTNVLSKSGSSKINSINVKNNKLNLQINAADRVRVVAGIPFQEGWKVTSNKHTRLVNYGGWLSFDLNEGQSDVVLEFSPYIFNNTKLPFILMYLNITFFVLIVVNRLKSAKKL
jgi:hypothetical protein